MKDLQITKRTVLIKDMQLALVSDGFFAPNNELSLVDEKTCLSAQAIKNWFCLEYRSLLLSKEVRNVWGYAPSRKEVKLRCQLRGHEAAEMELATFEVAEPWRQIEDKLVNKCKVYNIPVHLAMMALADIRKGRQVSYIIEDIWFSLPCGGPVGPEIAYGRDVS